MTTENATPQPDAPAAPPEEEQRRIIPPQCRQVILPSTAISVLDQDGKRMLVIQVSLPREDLVIPMSIEAAQEVGSKLMGPSVIQPTPRGDLIVPPGVFG